MNKFTDIKAKFTPREMNVIRSAFSELKTYSEEDDFIPEMYGFTEEQIEEGAVPVCEFEADVWKCLDSFKKKGRYFVLDGESFLKLCDLLHTALRDYDYVLYTLGNTTADYVNCDDAEDLSCIAEAISIVMRNYAVYECKYVARKIRKAKSNWHPMN